MVTGGGGGGLQFDTICDGGVWLSEAKKDEKRDLDTKEGTRSGGRERERATNSWER